MMNPAFKSLVMNVLPPIVFHGLLAVDGRRNKWRGNYPDWSSAVAASAGYDADTIFDTARKAAVTVRDGHALWERDSTCFYEEEYNWQLLACLMTVAARSGGKLHVLDFGGAFGSTYMQHRKLLTTLPECSWSVVEQPHVVNCGKAEFTMGALDFFSEIEQCFSIHPINVILFSGVLQYLESPYELLEKVNMLSPVAIIIDRTPVSKHGERITIQHVPKSIYSASYPCRFLDKQRLQEVLTKGRVLSPWFDSSIDPPNFVGVMSMIDGGIN